MNETEAITEAVIDVFRKTMSAGALNRIRPDVEAAVNKIILAHTQDLVARELRPITTEIAK